MRNKTCKWFSMPAYRRKFYTCVKLFRFRQIYVRVKVAKHTRRVNSISSSSLSVIVVGVGVIAVEFRSRWCLVLRRKSNDNIVDILCSNFAGERGALTMKGNRISPNTTHRRNITVKPRTSTSKRVKRPSNTEAMCKRKIHDSPESVVRLFWTLAPAKEWRTVWNHAWRHC